MENGKSLSLFLSSINILFFCLFLNSHSLKRWYSTGPSLGGMKFFFILITFYGKNIFPLSSSISRSVTILLMQALFHNEGTVWERKVGWELRVWDKEKYTGIVRQEWCIHFFPTKNHMHPDSWCIMGLEICSFRNWFCLVFSKIRARSKMSYITNTMLFGHDKKFLLIARQIPPHWML